MREEITEPQHWRSRPANSRRWLESRRTDVVPLPVEAVDAVFDSDQRLAVSQSPAEPATYLELVERIHEQLAVLEAQRVQLKLLLSQASDIQS